MDEARLACPSLALNVVHLLPRQAAVEDGVEIFDPGRRGGREFRVGVGILVAIDAWPTLPDVIRAGILATVNAAGNGNGG